jgi:hypothetical protein
LLRGAAASAWDNRLDENSERRHVAAPYHVTPLFKTTGVSGPMTLAALSWAGTGREAPAPWQIVSGAAESWKLQHPVHGLWEINHWSLPGLT